MSLSQIYTFLRTLGASPLSISSPSSLSALLSNQLRQNPERLAFIFIGETGTERMVQAAEVDRDSGCFARTLEEASIQPGDLLILSFTHSYELIVAFLGALYAGAVPAIIPPAPPYLSEAAYRKRILAIAEATEAHAVVTNAASLHTTLAPLLKQAGRATIAYQLAPAVVGNSLLCDRKYGDTAFIQFSSGSTSAPKGVVIQNQTVQTYLDVTAQHMAFDATDVSVGWLPLNHDMGLMMQVLMPLSVGACSVMMKPEHWVRAPEILLQAIHTYRGTMTWMPNFGFGHILTRLEEKTLEWLDLRSWRVLGSGGEPTQVDLLHRFADRLAPNGFRHEALVVGYGMAEAVAGVTQTPHDQLIRAEHLSTRVLHEEGRAVLTSDEEAVTTTVTSCGTPKFGIEMRIVDEAHRPLPERHIGEISVRSLTLFAGYHLRPDLTEQVFHDGWYHTGDLGYLADGELYVCGRKSDLIVLGGKNAYAHHLEAIARNVLGRLAGRVVAFGISDNALGTETAIIVCELREMLPPDLLDTQRIAIRTAVRERMDVSLGDVRFVEKGWVIRTTSGKLARSANRQKYKATFPSRKTTKSDLDFDKVSGDVFESKLRQVVAGIWQEVLGIHHIDSTESLLDLGGDSLQASRILTRLRERLSISVSLAEFFEMPTVDGIVNILVDRDSK